MDSRTFEGVDEVANLTSPWPWDSDSIEEIHMSHVLEHFTGDERVHIFNEMYRVMKKDAKALIITPYWCSNRALGDFTHQWPPVSEMLYYYLDKNWRAANAPHCDKQWNPKGYECDFLCSWGYNSHPLIAAKHSEAQIFAWTFYKEAAQDLICTVSPRK